MDAIFTALLLFAYLSGSISAAIIICKILTLPDPRITGSHNPGTTNVLRIGGKKAALCTLAGDLLKTAIPIIIGIYLNYSQIQLCWLGVCALLGHCFPVYYGLKGGKGVACMFAILLLITPELAALVIACWTVLAWIFRRSSFASIIAAVIIPVVAYHFYASLLLPLAALSAVVVLRHRKNIANLLEGKEPLIR